MSDKTKDIFDRSNREGASETDRMEMLAMFHRNELEYEVKGLLLENLQGQPETGALPDLDSLYRKVLVRIRKGKQRSIVERSGFGTLLKIAAVLVIGLVSGYLLTNKQQTSDPAFFTARAPKGSVSQLLLPDGTLIFLNSGSEISYAFHETDGQRNVYLNGEAWFQVGHDKEKPFVVNTGLYNVKVLGTEFNVKAYRDDNELVTTLEKGSVEIVSSPSLKLANPVTLKPGEQVVYNKSENSLRRRDVNTKWFTSWKENKLIFINMNLKELIVLLERRYGVDIEVKTPDILKYHYDGTIKDETIIQVMDLLKLTLPVDYVVRDQTIEIYKTN